MGYKDETCKQESSSEDAEPLPFGNPAFEGILSKYVLRTLLDLESQPAFLLDITDFSIASMNTCAEERIAFSNPDCFLSLHGIESHPSTSSSGLTIEQARRLKKPVELNHKHLKGNGELCHHKIRAIPVFDSRERIAYIIEIWNTQSGSTGSKVESAEDSEPKKIGIHLYEARDDRLILTGANPAADNLLGVDSSQLLGTAIEDAFPSMIGTAIPEKYREVALTGATWSNIWAEYTNDGVCGAFDVHAFQTSPGRMIAAFTDLTERKKIDDKLRRSEETHHTIVESMHDLILIFDSSNRCIEYYASTDNILYRSLQQLRGRRIHDFLPKDAADRFLTAAEATRSRGISQEIDFPIPLGEETRWFSANLKMHEDNCSLVSIIKDITDEKLARSHIVEQRDFLERVIESLTHPFHVIDANDYSIKMANSAANIGPIDSSSKCYFLTHRRNLPCLGNEHPCPLKTIKETKQPTVVEHTHSDIKGNIRHVEVHAYPVFGSEGEVIQMITYALDVTDQRLAERQVALESRRARLYLDLLGHDMANELQVIQGSVEILGTPDSYHQSNEFQQRLREQILDSVRRCNKLIKSARATETLAIAPLVDRSLGRAVTQSIEMIQEIFGDVKIIFENELGDCMVVADKFLEDLLLNLIQNAIENNPSSFKNVWIAIRDSDNGFEVAIADNGPGIPDNLKAYLFDPFQRISGVGLHFSAEVVQKYGGSIHVRDRVHGNSEEGVEFVIWLPKPGGLLQ